ncbi:MULTISPECIES: transcriptional regulator [unclassified Streptomyces]|uniref:transcriptional regulator n=1 Tax=unclassified Streptomyces TaxID=2593676 RepID=UPI00088C4718|nr:MULTISPECIES: transcriptional regulator [unclassified Streptomyces]PBC84739.1 winged helix DNA-binding protein [Streptomyces sp. 2321.6]SDR27306.1 Winged helix DNA-binding domain-containing protein [Streptomyces sp. KS_16]SED42704.1 Winged helix DNA-binding domain-containing protein [Streptomyces sp. 2133.1]SNC70762.1 Winged helix DNA-binding domain-containing protein [Streptomyces sp. 2114.4]
MSVEDPPAAREQEEREEELLHPTRSLDDTVHQRVRLGILAVAREADRVEFSFLKKQLAVTDGNLSRHLKVLEESDLITVEKGYAGRRPRTWIVLTREGAQALDTELRALRALVLRLEAPRPASGQPDA